MGVRIYHIESLRLGSNGSIELPVDFYGPNRLPEGKLQYVLSLRDGDGRLNGLIQVEPSLGSYISGVEMVKSLHVCGRAVGREWHMFLESVRIGDNDIPILPMLPY